MVDLTEGQKHKLPSNIEHYVKLIQINFDFELILTLFINNTDHSHSVSFEFRRDQALFEQIPSGKMYHIYKDQKYE